MKPTLIFGHRNPDTDTVCSSISLSYLKNALGEKTLPRVLGTINRESRFVLNYFKIKEPEYLNNVNIQIRNVRYNKGIYISENASIKECFEYMQDKSINAVPIINDNRKLVGFITLKEIATLFINSEHKTLNTTLDKLVSSLKGQVLVGNRDVIYGNVIAGGYHTNTFINEIEIGSNDILIVGDRHNVIRHAIQNKVQCIVLTGDFDLPKDILSEAKKNKVLIISTPLDTYNTANAITMSNLIKSLDLNKHPTIINDTDYLDDFLTLSSRIGHTNYPVVNKKGDCLGLLRINDASKFEKRKVILVDHNNFEQTVPGIEEADIVEIIDHHNLGAIGTTVPINFRCKPVGCTCTIIYELYMENNIDIPIDVAGLMLSAIISDTMLFKSPTCTNEDIVVAKRLAEIAQIDEIKYGMEMLREASSVKDMSVNDVIFQDFKSYNVDGKRLGISQVMTMDFDEIKKNLDEYVQILNETSSGYDAITIFITDVILNGSYVIYNDTAKDLVMASFDLDDVYEGYYLNGIVSRKKQMLPGLMENINKAK